MRRMAALLLLALPAVALPPLTPGFVRMKDLRRSIDARIAELQQEEAFKSKPREERMLLTYGKQEEFEGRKIDARDVVEACFAWGEANGNEPTEAAIRTLRLLPGTLFQRCGGPNADRKERRQASIPLLKALDSDSAAVREAAIESLRKIYDAPRVDRYDPAQSAKERNSPIKAWKRAVLQQNR
ncbi:MAG TPA: hypothetical protein VFY93_17770 [Planctomycetota bacterium]|nr:hypothetical protein [Planctomycetota bacterium]